MRTLRVLVVALLLLVGVATHAAATEQYTLDSSIASTSEVAALWSKNTKVSVAVGSCSGEHCIHAVLTQGTSCDSGISGAPECTFRNADGSYTVQVASWTLMYDTALTRNAQAHGVGHAIIHSLGGGYWHNPNKRSIMYYLIGAYDRAKPVLKSDRDKIASLLGG